MFAGNPPNDHDDYAIVVVEPAVHLDHIAQAPDEIRDLLWEVRGVRVLSCAPHPLGLGIFKFASILQRDIMVYGSPHDIVPHHLVRFLKHDEAIS